MTRDFSAFDIIGPRMTGPSSSHTAGAAKIGSFACKLFGSRIKRAEIELHGSFAATGNGHATDRAIINGLLNHPIDWECLDKSIDEANSAGLHFHFETVNLGDNVHPNSVRLTLFDDANAAIEIQAASVGGGDVEITQIDRFPTSFRAKGFVLVIWNKDNFGFLARLTGLIAADSVNIAEMHVTRNHKAGEVLTVCVIDAPIRKRTVLAINELPNLIRARLVATDEN